MAVIGCFPGGMGGSSLLIAAVPSQSGTLIYNGSEQTPTWANYDENQLIISGEISATNAGTYTVTFTPRSNCYWSNGTSEGRDVTWTIAKAQGLIFADKTEIELNGANREATIEITRLGDGEIVAESNNPDIVQVSVEETTVVVMAEHASGTYSITIYAEEGTNYTASAPIDVTVTCDSPSLDEASWEHIAEIASSGAASSYWAVGDRKAVTLNGTIEGEENEQTYLHIVFNNETYYAYILGFDHNAYLEGNNLIHFQFGYTASENGTAITFYGVIWDGISGCYSSKTGGWKDSYGRNICCSEFEMAMPSDLQSVLATVVKYTDNGTGSTLDVSSHVTATEDKVFLPAEYEVFGTYKYANKYEQNWQKQYDYFALGNSKIRYRHDDEETSCEWYLRSPSKYENSIVTDHFGYCAVTSTGVVENAVFTRNGFSPCFCVGGAV